MRHTKWSICTTGMFVPRLPLVSVRVWYYGSQYYLARRAFSNFYWWYFLFFRILHFCILHFEVKVKGCDSSLLRTFLCMVVPMAVVASHDTLRTKHTRYRTRERAEMGFPDVLDVM